MNKTFAVTATKVIIISLSDTNNLKKSINIYQINAI